MRPTLRYLAIADESFPRVSGDAPSLRVLDPTQCLFSPRERGCAGIKAAWNGQTWVFPA